VVTVDDDGVGGSTAHGNGLAGLAERAIAVGGRLEVRPRRWRGFRLQAAMPVERPDAA
jgi:two-component system sensor histidine kinase DesK